MSASSTGREADERYRAAAAEIAARYPDPGDEQLREAAREAALAYLADPDAAYARHVQVFRRARERERRARAAVRQVVVMAIEDGKQQAPVAREIGVDRMALRKWLRPKD